MRIFLLSLLSVLLLFQSVQTCNICGGGTGELIVLALDGRALFNAGLFLDSYKGVWDENGSYLRSDYTKNQYRYSLSGAYRINSHIQFALTLPFITNTSNVPGLKSMGTNVGDIIINGRYEFFHEYQIKHKNDRDYVDKTLPYFALTCGLTIPTGKSEETAENDVDVTGKGFFMSSLGLSLTKSVVENKFQVSMDLSWQHSFNKTFDMSFGQKVTPYDKKQGERYNYSLMFNYIINSWHAAAFSVSGYSQNSYSINSKPTDGSEEHNINFTLMYTYYPSQHFRVTPSLKWNIPSNSIAKNSPGSTTFGVNLTYYIEDNNIK